ncbi:MAG: 6-carboxytetrahydropterin synthase [bacterium]|nr:6-carboxytetrahydropterin synthase [bacterium]
MTFSLTRSIRFCAAHRLFNPAWSDEENFRVFGKCSLPGGHGHTYLLTVTVSGPLDPHSGMIINVATLRDILRREVFDLLDHRDLNHDVPFLQGLVPTMENIAQKLAERLQPVFAAHQLTLTRLSLAESDHHYVTIDLP